MISVLYPDARAEKKPSSDSSREETSSEPEEKEPAKVGQVFDDKKKMNLSGHCSSCWTTRKKSC